jgi:type I restriction enzyme, S subunit
MNWPSENLGNLCEIKIGRTPSRACSDYWGGSHPWSSISDMGGAKYLQLTKELITDLAIEQCNMRKIEPGTVIFSFKLSIGKVSIAKVPLFTNEAIAALPIKHQSELNGDYLYHALQLVARRISGNRAAKGETLNKGSLALIEIPLPPMKEQLRIASALDSIEDQVARHLQAASELRDLYSIMGSDLLGVGERVIGQ